MLAVLLLTSIGLQLLNPQILRYFIDTAIAGGATTSLVLAGVIFIGVALLNLGISVATTYFSEYVAWMATNQLRVDLVAHCLALDMSFHKEHTSGELIERIDGDVDALSNFFSQLTLDLLNNAFHIIILKEARLRPKERCKHSWRLAKRCGGYGKAKWKVKIDCDRFATIARSACDKSLLHF